LPTATALIVGETIAVGIFLTPAGMAKSLGSPAWLFSVWLIMGGAVGAIISLAVINICGVKLGAWLVRWMTVLKLELLAFILLWGFGLQLGDWSTLEASGCTKSQFDSASRRLSGRIVSAFFSFGGWRDIRSGLINTFGSAGSRINSEPKSCGGY
jgi:amino acid transporter